MRINILILPLTSVLAGVGSTISIFAGYDNLIFGGEKKCKILNMKKNRFSQFVLSLSWTTS